MLHISRLQRVRHTYCRSFCAFDLLLGIGEAQIKDDSIAVVNYPFKPSQVYPSKRISPDRIAEIHVGHNIVVPTVQLTERDELIFVSSDYRAELKEFAVKHRIPLTERESNWRLLTKPFLNAEPNKSDIEMTISKLQSNGFTINDIQRIRNEVKEQLNIYNFDTEILLSDHLDLSDVLQAMTGAYSGRRYIKFYWDAMEIEVRTNREKPK